MKLSDIKHLVNILEQKGINDDYDLNFSWFDEGSCIDLVLENTDNDNQLFDIGHSDKIVNIFVEENDK